MPNKEKLLLFVPILDGLLSSENLKSIAAFLIRYDHKSFKGPTNTSQWNASFLINSLIASNNASSLIRLGEALKDFGLPILPEIIQLVIGTKGRLPFYWLLEHWNEVVVCENSLYGLHDCVRGMQCTDKPTVKDWLHILHNVATDKLDTCKFFFAQLQRNVACSVSDKGLVKDEHGKAMWHIIYPLLVPVLDPIFEEETEDFREITEALTIHGVARQGDFKKIRRSKERCINLLEIIDQSTNEESVSIFLDAIKEKAYGVFADIIALHLQRNLPNVTWFLVHWKKLSYRKHSSHIERNAYFTTRESLNQSDFPMLLILFNVAKTSDASLDAFMQSIYHLAPRIEIILPQYDPASSKHSAEQQSSLQLESRHGNSATYSFVHNGSSDTSSSTKRDSVPPGNPKHHSSTNVSADVNGTSKKSNQYQDQTKLQEVKKPRTVSPDRDHSTNSRRGKDERSCNTSTESKNRDSNFNSAQGYQSRTFSAVVRDDKNGNVISKNRNSGDAHNGKDNHILTRFQTSVPSARSTMKADSQSLSNRVNSSTERVTPTDNDSKKVDDAQAPQKTADYGSSSASSQVEVEFRMIVDEQSVLPDMATFYVQLLNADYTPQRHILHALSNRKKLMFGSRVLLYKTPLTYKYVYVDSCTQEHWEGLPHSSGQIVNRKTHLSSERMESGKVILFDVTSFWNSNSLYSMYLGEFGTMYSRNVRLHLPDASLITIGSSQEDGNQSFTSCLKHIEEWWQCGLSTVSFDVGRPLKTAATFKAELRIYVKNNHIYGNTMDSTQKCRRVLLFMAVLLVMKRNEISLDQVLNEICAGLSLSNIKEADLKLLYHEITQNQALDDILLAIESLIKEEKLKETIRALWLIPLYYFLLNCGNVTHIKQTWEKALKKFNFDAIRSSIDHKDVVGNSPVIKTLLNTFPRLMEVYQYVVPCSTILHLVSSNDATLKTVDAGSFLVRMCEEIRTDNYSKYTKNKNLNKWINSYLDELITKCQDSTGDDKYLLSNISKICKVILNPWKIMKFCDEAQKDVEILLKIAMKTFTSWFFVTQRNSTSQAQLEKWFAALLQTTIGWLKQDNDDKVSFCRIKLWDYLLDVDFIIEPLQKTWKSEIKQTLQGILFQKFSSDKHNSVMIMFLERLDKIKPSEEVQTCFSEAIYQAAEKAQKEKSGFFDTYILKRSDFQKKLSPLLQRLFLARWKDVTSTIPSEVLKFTLNWPFTATFFKLFDDSQQSKLLKKEIRDTMNLIKQQYQHVVDELESGRLLFPHLHLICEAQIIFMDVLSVFQKGLDYSVDNCKTVSARRVIEMEAYLQARKSVEYTKSLCQACDLHVIDLSRLSNIMEKKMEKVRWCDVVEIQSDLISDDVNVTFFELSKDVKEAMKEILHYGINETEFIREIWLNEVDEYLTKEREKSEDNSNRLPVDVISVIWKSVKQRMATLKEQFSLGNLTLSAVDEMFQKLSKDEIEKVAQIIFSFPDSDHSDNFESGSNFPQDYSDDYATAGEDENEFLSADERTTDDNLETLLLCESDQEEETNLRGAADLREVEIEETVHSYALLTHALSIPQEEEFSSSAESGNFRHCPEDDVQVAPTGKEEPTDDFIESFDNPELLSKRRVEQICNYFALKRQQDTASVFLKLKECLDLSGDFSYIDVVQQNENLSRTKPLKCITDKIMKASKSIEDIDLSKIFLISEFVKNKELVDWLRENMKDRGEVKVMSDLAMISAGETSIEVAKVSCFLSAVMGFAPFIFDLQKNGSLNDVFLAFENVSSSSDESLVNKWHATAELERLAWLKGIKDFHGSVEKSSLARAQDINSSGVYKVGGEIEKIPTIENALTLEVVHKSKESTDKKDSIHMNMDELRNLQSRLMLIAGEADKGLDDVKQFIDVLFHVENLAKAYVKLKLAGCLLFNNWVASIRCAPQTQDSEESISSMEIMFDNVSQPVLCVTKVIREIKNLTDIMTSLYIRWKENLSEKRRKFYHLNHYNIHQMTYLCKELANVHDEHSIPDQVYTLLASVKPDVNGSEIMQLLMEAIKIKEDAKEELEEDVVEEDISEVSYMEKKRQMVRRLVEEEISERLAKAVIQDCGLPLDYDECYIKALELEYDHDDLVNDLVKEFDKESGFDADTSEINVDHSVVNDRSPLTLQSIIEKILNNRNDGNNLASVAVKTICERYVAATTVTSLKDCISTEHLGSFLMKLSTKVEKKDIPQRKFPDPLEEGKPNLVICPEHDIYATVLSLFMCSPDQSLPSTSEVLLCSETTTKEEIELLLLRAISREPNLGKSIYCLASAEKLNFHVASATENMMKQIEKDPNVNKNYRLVIVCTSSQHFMASLLYERRIDYTHRYSPENIQQYLTNHLQLEQNSLMWACFQGRESSKTSVLVVSSDRAGLGKSLHINRCRSRLLGKDCQKLLVRLLDKELNQDDIMHRLFHSQQNTQNRAPHFVHFDITPSVQHGVGYFLFNLFVLGAFKDSVGTLWRRHASHVYLIEYTNATTREGTTETIKPVEGLFSFLPSLQCISPRKALKYYTKGHPDHVLLMDDQEFASDSFQRPYQYLTHYDRGRNLDRFCYERPEGTADECINILLKYCSIDDPTWSELRHFASFLNNQLSDCEKSYFCNETLVGADSGLSGFKKFVVRFMIRMSQDFATPSLNENIHKANEGNEGAIFELHQLRRRWEESVHPYLFFNEDGMSMTFVNFRIDNNGNLLHPKNTLEVMERGLMGPSLVKGLKLQKVNLNEDFDNLSRVHKLLTLRRVMGLNEMDCSDPDPSYELTTDNVLKMLAIHMRFRCGIPVVIMGETGCGKTRMVEFMSRLKSARKAAELKQKIPQKDVKIDNMFVIKVHGGVSVSTIQNSVRDALRLARLNKERCGVDTMLFLDEANTTEAIYAIKEFVCDGTVNGEFLQDAGLQIVCACNPYRMHSEEAIATMAESGLGFRVKTEDTTDKLGSVPMRCLVYRVIALPPSMKPLVWDFGQLTNDSERIYIEQMVEKLQRNKEDPKISFSLHDRQLIVSVLSASQKYMRNQRQQCLFVSLRDVERCLQSFTWFLKNCDWLYHAIDQQRDEPFCSHQVYSPVIIRTLLQAIGMCYHVTLEKRESYLVEVSNCFKASGFELSSSELLNELTACQKVFINNIDVEDNIARNEALRENVFMIVMCTEMRIPLFLIGKPGSSKSLAKTIVTDVMQGSSSRSSIFKRLKQIHILSFQCSAVSDAVGIEAVFKQCAQVQQNQDINKFVSVVVLDEVGLAEDSPKMPLKVLHPLLEGSSTGINENVSKDEKLAQHKVGFVGISNWALDPAKMNRGIFVHRGDPSENDLKVTAKGIFSSDSCTSKQYGSKFKDIEKVVNVLTTSYIHIKKKEEEEKEQEFFGLRDYYGLLKMIFAVVKKTDSALDYFDVADAIKRNFSGGRTDCFEIFLENIKSVWPAATAPTTTIKKMINDNLNSVEDGELESRFLLLLSNRFAAVGLLNEVVDCSKFQVIFGSSFPQDNGYTELCRNINKIKICMESGCTVVLLNLRDLYESLYDALNQHYVTFAGQRYVDLGLGGHRVKCRVAQKFRLIVIEDENVVYDEFPIPLINRLEKYVFTTESLLDGNQKNDAGRLNSWIGNLAKIDIPLHKRQTTKQFSPKDCLVGYVEDSAASALLSVINSKSPVEAGKLILLNTATVDSVFRLPTSGLIKQAEKLQKTYFEDQFHDNLISFFENVLLHKEDVNPRVFEITSFSQILKEQDRLKIEQSLNLSKNSVMLLTLQQFQTQGEYHTKVESFFSSLGSSNDDYNHSSSAAVLLVQCPHADRCGSLIACARFSLKNVIQSQKCFDIRSKNPKILIAFLYTVERQCGKQSTNSFFSFHSSDCMSVHIDELRPTVDYMGPPSNFWKKSMGEIFERSVHQMRDPAKSSAQSNFVNPKFLLDPNTLIQACIPSAMVKLRNSNETDEAIDRNRVKLVFNLCYGESMVSVSFMQILLQRVSELLKDRDGVVNPTQWSFDEACSQEALYEGGTFSKTLWLKLRKIIILGLAKIVSILDEDNNLDIISSDQRNSSLPNLWLGVFSDETICKFSWIDILQNHGEFAVLGSSQFSCSFPFSRRITACFNRVWSAFPSHDIEKRETGFARKIRDMKIADMLVEAFSSRQMQLLSLYVSDLIRLQYKPATNTPLEFELAEGVLQAIFKCRVTANPSFHDETYIPAAYSLFMTSELQLKQLSAIINVLPEVLTKESIAAWLDVQDENEYFVTHILAYHAMLNQVKTFKHDEKDQSGNLSVPERYRQWRVLVTKVLNLKLDLNTVSPTVEIQKCLSEIHTMRSALAFVELFLNMLIPEGLSSKLFSEYLKVLAPLSKRLWMGAKITGLSHAKFLKIVMDTLRGCSKDVFLKHLLSWKDLQCKHCKNSRVVNPVILPCDHYFCTKCIKLSTAANVRECPTCRASFSFDFALTPSRLNPEQAKDFEGFKTNCTSFFLQYLSTLCFPPQDAISPEMSLSSDISDALQNLVVKKTLTREMTPIDMETFDETPTVRSFILQLLLRYNPKNTHDVLENHFKKINEVFSDKHELMLIYIRCVEDSLRNRATVTEKNISTVGFILELIEELEEDILASPEEMSQVQILDAVARIRFCMKEIAKMVYKLHSDNCLEEQIKTIVPSLEALSGLVKKHNLCLARDYFVKVLCRRFGLGIFHHLVRKDEFVELMPLELNPDSLFNEAGLTSSLFVLGDEYAATQKLLFNVETPDAVQETVIALHEKALKSRDTAVQVLHATYSWLENSQNAIKQTIWTDLLKTLNKSANDYKDIATYFFDLRENNKVLIPISSLSSDVFHILQEFVLVACSTIFAGKGTVLEDLLTLVVSPHLIQSWFLPTMPQSGYFDVKDIVSTWKDRSCSKPPKAYKCPSGHVYFIADCTNPNEPGVCPDCHQKIGGQNSTKLQPGNEAGELTESSQAGYLLGIPENCPDYATPERKLESGLSVCVVRMVLHAALLQASRNGNFTIRNMEYLEARNLQEFFLKHLHVNFKQLLNCLGKSADDASLFLHQILKEMRSKKNFTHSYEANLTSMKGRKLWEEEFYRQFLVPVLAQTDEKIEEARKICSSCQKQNALERLVFEIPSGDEKDIPQEQDEEAIGTLNSPSLWKYQIHASVTHLRQKLHGLSLHDNREGETLKLILNNTDLIVLRNLLKLLKLQNSLIQRFHRKVDMSDVDNMTIREYLLEGRTVPTESFQLYVEVWNLIKGSLPHPNPHGTPLELLREEMSLGSSISMCLPSKAGKGTCALAFMEFLVEKQNDFLLKCRDTIRPEPSFMEIHVDDLSIDDLVCIDSDQNLMPLILANSQYEVSTGETGTKHKIVYRIGPLEKQVTDKFILNKKFINKATLPCMEYLQDMGIGQECQAMAKNVKQSPLSPKIVHKVDEILEKARLPEICEGVRTLTLVISFLAKIGSDPTQSLIKYITEDLMVSPNEAAMIPRAALLCHTLALYERLSWQRSVRFVASGQDPFANINKRGDHEDIGNVDEIKKELDLLDIPQLQRELNSLILMKQDLEPQSSLRDNLYAYLVEKYEADEDVEEGLAWCLKLPERLLVKHAPHLFRISV